tara:strand:- start:58925 stop:59893 length:969 start_codon:yes stop_codon:yes gene_type:complete
MGGDEVPMVLSGATMGTYYRVSVSTLPLNSNAQELKAKVEAILDEVNQQMSTYLSNSELSLFNSSESIDWFSVSEDTAKVISKGIDIYNLSSGAFDITIGPLVNLWGFGPLGRRDNLPTDTEIAAKMTTIGSDNLKVRLSPPALKKSFSNLNVDLSAIAKGFAVDRLSEMLNSLGTTAFLVDIGGEMRAKGTRRGSNSVWRIGIESPVVASQQIQKVVELDNSSIATSGDYRNYFEVDKVRYSHEIDPRTGRPISHRLASVTVVDASCMDADGWATALLILGTDEGYALANQKDLAAFFVIKTEEGFEEKMTVRFRNLIKKE